MITIIICARRDKPDASFLKNVASTIGCPYEVIAIDNSSNQHSIFSAYNLGASQSRYDVLCFMHDDIHFKSTEWGSTVINLLEKPSVGVVGVAGATIKTKSPSPWWIANGYNAQSFLSYNIVQKRKGEWVHEQSKPNDLNFTEVAVLDGVWMCCRREVWNLTKFDQKTFSGFHFYDLDFCIQAKESGYKNYVTHDILLEHGSTGSANYDWLESADIFHEKWKQILPISVNPLSKDCLSELEYQAQKGYLRLMIRHNYKSSLKKIKAWLQLGIKKALTKDDFRLLYNILKVSITRNIQ